MPEGQRWFFWSLTTPGMSHKLQNIFLWFLKDSWIVRRSKIILLKFDKSRNVWQASKYFSRIFKRLLDCQKIQDDFTEVWQVLECLASFKIFFYDFKSLLHCKKVQEYLPEVWQVLECLASFKVFFQYFLMTPGLPESPRLFLWSLRSLGMSGKLQNIFLWFFKRLLDCQKVQEYFSEVREVLESLASF